MGPLAQPVPSTSAPSLQTTSEVSPQEEGESESSSSISEVPAAKATFESQSSSTTSEGEADTSIWVDEQHQQEVNRESLNTAIDRITEGRVSPIRSSLNTPWEEVTERQKNYYLKKAREAVKTTMAVIAPGQEQDLWRSLVQAPPFYREEQPPAKKKMWDQQTVQTLVKADQGADTWQTRQQMLSLFADDYTKDELQQLIPGLSKWRIDQARVHDAESGPGEPVQQQPIYRTRLNPVKTDHFLAFSHTTTPAVRRRIWNQNYEAGLRRNNNNTCRNPHTPPIKNHHPIPTVLRWRQLPTPP
ncbi:PREDICTED: uncharacterized protein LOC109470483 [Branchiostoma belcheri]|uniref:Uncharacterized protein LOC109470483 n=1 Tax=Branchiostoma belcheri TaxID=7741 RepID=A0A6P4YTC7_BRABE|nr:PREDICTED: uncharacterized protein LOC109470483 [Branchiostoma belcheri]